LANLPNLLGLNRLKENSLDFNIKKSLALYIMFDYIQYAYGKWKGDGISNANSIVIPISQDQLRSQLRNPIEKKPASYKSINASSVNIFENNLKKNGTIMNKTE
jgi:hypothetical protein